MEAIEDPQVRRDCRVLARMMNRATRAGPEMWGSSIVGFGRYHYRYADGRDAEWMLTGFSPRRRNLTIYIMLGFERYGQLLARLGKHSHGKCCLYVRRLSDLHLPTLEKLIRDSVRELRRR